MNKFELDTEISKLNTPSRYDRINQRYNYSEQDIIDLFDKKEMMDKKFQMHLIDVVWGEAFEDKSVPSTVYAEKILDLAKESFDNVS